MSVKHRRATNSFDGTDVCNSGRRLDVGHMLGIGDLLGLHVVDELVDETGDCFATSLQKNESQSVEQRKKHTRRFKMSLYGMSYMLSTRCRSASARRLKPIPGNHAGKKRT